MLSNQIIILITALKRESCMHCILGYNYEEKFSREEVHMWK